MVRFSFTYLFKIKRRFYN